MEGSFTAPGNRLETIIDELWSLTLAWQKFEPLPGTVLTEELFISCLGRNNCLGVFFVK